MVFSNMFLIHDFFVLLFLPVVTVMDAVVIFYLIDFLNSKKKFLNPKLRKIILGVFFVWFLISFLIYSYKASEDILRGNRNYWEIVEFLFENDGNVIVSFNECPCAHQTRFYLDGRNIQKITEKNEFIEFIGSTSIDFKYYILKGSSQPSQDLENYLDSNYSYQEIRENDNHNYKIYSLNS